MYYQNTRKLKCLCCGTTESALYINADSFMPDGICHTCLTVLQNKTADIDGICYFRLAYGRFEPACSEKHIHFTHKNNLFFEKNIGICAEHVKIGLQYFAEKQAQTAKQKPEPKPQPKPVSTQLSLF